MGLQLLCTHFLAAEATWVGVFGEILNIHCTVRAMCIAALHARNTREKTPYCVQIYSVICERNRKIHALACKKLHAVSLEVRVKISHKD